MQYDSGPNDSENRILIFATDKNLEHMEKCEHWYADGTFKSSPSIFAQLYTIHGAPHTNIVPTVYALLPKKTEATYITLLEKLNEFNPNLKPKSIMLDFEQAAINAFKKVFQNISVRVCFFHLSQCVWRKIQSAGKYN